MRLIETSLEKLARVLSRAYDVQVIFEGEQAYTDGQKIVLPWFHTLTEELELMLNGYLDHEVAHVKFTEFPQVKHVINAYHHKLLNGVEDVRIERLMIDAFPGTKYHIDSMNETLIKDLKKNWFKMPWSIRFIMQVSFIMEGNVELMEDEQIEKYITLCQPEIDTLNNCHSTKELRVVTESMVKKLINELSDEEKKQKEEKSDKKESGESKEDSENGEGENSDDSKSGESEDSDDSAGKESDKKPKSTKNGKPSKGTPKGSPSKAEGDKLVTAKKDSELEKYEIDVHSMIDNAIQKQLEKEAKEAENMKHNYNYSNTNGILSIPVTTKYDRLHNLVGADSRNEYPRMKEQVRPLVNTLKYNLEKIFKSIENVRWKTEKEQGIINARGLSNLASNQNYRGIFKEQVKNETDKVAISILVDLSGSMGSKVQTAKLASTAMSEALKGLGIEFEVVGFNTGSSSALSNHISSLNIQNTKRFNRFSETLEHFVFKSFGSNNLNGLSQMQSSGANADGESVMWAAKRLAERKEKRKILIVMSDGMPSCGGDDKILQSDLRMKLSMIEKFGVETVGIGIQTDAVKHFYKDNLVINNLNDLTTNSLKKLEAILLKGLRNKKY